MAKKLDIALHSDYSPEICLSRLAHEIDVDDRSFFSFSGYKGDKPIVGKIKGNEFRLHKRRYWHNSFGPVLFGRMTVDGHGTLLEGYWDMWRSTRVFMRGWLGLLILICAPFFFDTLKCAMNAQCADQESSRNGLLIISGMFLWGLLLPRLGGALSFHERKSVIELLRETLLAGRAAIPTRERGWDSSLDVFRL
ncbi:MAG: hypothetical protein DMG37_15615 [Acidobacteria bacterium]|nr:MAG: hypothetical protein DMG37_15615 [Acidobacteriota bacterium]